MRFRGRAFGPAQWLSWWLCCCPLALAAAEPDDCRTLFLKGDYAECARLAETGMAEDRRNEEWPLWRVKALLTLGRYPEAREVIDEALKRLYRSIRLRLLGYEVMRQNGDRARADQLLQEINELGGTRIWDYRDARNLVALGRAALLLGADARRVLENFFDQAKRADPDYREVYLAAGELALAKNDFAEAARTFQEGRSKFPQDPDMLCGLARAFAPSDRAQMGELLEAALGHNPRHVPSHLLLAEHLIDAERYAAADDTLAKVLAVNPWQPEAWAYRAVMALLRSDAQAASQARATGLKFWPTNPLVDHLIGRKLSQKYLFAEGAAYQRRALSFERDFAPARIQLAQDLLRLGEEEGWQLAQQAHEADAYDVTAYNLVTLRDNLAKFRTLTNSDFIVRMSEHEARLYGDRALALLQRAKDTLAPKYGWTPRQPTIVEIFPEQKDFAVRTFGMPGNPGFLGVCFGRLITANSPASQGDSPENWQAVLWHEFCHVITLQLTRNRMPRWLSEGISVYEERLADPAWGQHLHSEYRQMILGEDFVPISELSAAFLSPKSHQHVQFAYYESSLVVEFLVERFGFESLKAILRDLGEGKSIDAAISAHTAPMPTVESDFAAFARTKAEQLGPDLDWAEPPSRKAARAAAAEQEGGRRRVVPFGLGLPEEDAAWEATHPNNFFVLLKQAKQRLAEKQWAAAKTPLRKLLEAYPRPTGPDNLYLMLAAAHRGLDETEAEREALTKAAELAADAAGVYARLMELESARANWPAVKLNAERFLAVNPLLPEPYRFLAQAAEALADRPTAIDAYRRLLLLDPPDPAQTHFQLARLLHAAADPEAKRHVLMALEEAPRFRDAHRLLLQIAEGRPSSSAVSPDQASASGAASEAAVPPAGSQPVLP